jgi:hypothetical protein
MMYTVQCVDCNYIFDDFEDEFGLCPECGKQQPASGSWATEELAHIERLRSSGKVIDAVKTALELLEISIDVEYGDWPFAYKISEIIRELCEENKLLEQLEQLNELWKVVESNQDGGSEESYQRIASYLSKRESDGK